MSYTSSLIRLLAVTVLCIAVGFPLYLRYKAEYRLNPAVVFGVFFGIVAALLLVHALLFWPGSSSQIYAELACLSGASLGWLLGMWLSPMGSNESTKFASYWTVIGVGSGFTAKWAFDRVVLHAGWFADHAFVSTLFAVAMLVTTAAVYNSRAYEQSLSLAPRKPLASTTVLNGNVVEIHAGTVAEFYAATVGPADPLCRWEVLPGTLGRVDSAGVFTAGAVTGEGRITAFNLEDPTLSNAIAIKVT